MDSRKENLLKLVVDNYLTTAEPVGSRFLIESASLELSGATVRNELRELEKEGLLRQPHISAGRVPTEKGYRYYINNIMKVEEPKEKIKKYVRNYEKYENMKEIDESQTLKNLAKYVSEYVNSAVIFAHNNDIYYTGISNLFAHPEFKDYEHTLSISTVFDQFEDLIDDMYDLVDGKDTKILIGEENPLGNIGSTVVIKVSDESLFAVLGPMRMDYGRSVGLLDYISKMF